MSSCITSKNFRGFLKRRFPYDRTVSITHHAYSNRSQVWLKRDADEVVSQFEYKPTLLRFITILLRIKNTKYDPPNYLVDIETDKSVIYAE